MAAVMALVAGDEAGVGWKAGPTWAKNSNEPTWAVIKSAKPNPLTRGTREEVWTGYQIQATHVRPHSGQLSDPVTQI
jgi:hypothetical protein